MNPTTSPRTTLGGTESLPARRSRLPSFRLLAACAIGLSGLSARAASVKESGRIELAENLTFTLSTDAGYRETQFFDPSLGASVVQVDARLEYWFPLGRRWPACGLFLRSAVITASEPQAFLNAWLAAPGGGFQLYPFASSTLREATGGIGDLLGPLRLFFDHNRQNYWGAANTWRPGRNARYGFEFWRQHNTNSSDAFWFELWSGFWHQSENDYDRNFDSWILAGSVRLGARVPDAGFLSTLTPYAVGESESTRHHEAYWNNVLKVGYGLRYAPLLKPNRQGFKWINRLVVYAERVRVQRYYYTPAPAWVPRHDVRIGLSLGMGELFN